MGKLAKGYRASIYTEVAELSEGKVYIVKSSLDDRIYIKKVLPVENYDIYTKIRELDIPNIPRIYEIIDMDDRVIIIEEYINGHSLEEILDEVKTLTEVDVVKYILDLVDILNELYRGNSAIIHRDIKPSNIMINNDGILKLIDFDISRIHKSNKSTDTNVLGTYGYAAPEQFGFDQTDIRADIYSIGATMNVLLTGKLPMEELHDGRLSKIISKCIELDPERRFQSTEKLKNELLKVYRKHNIGNPDYEDLKLPGFRSNRLIFRTIGFVWYLLLGMFLLGFFDSEPMAGDRTSNITFALFSFSLTLLYGDYRNIKSRLPILDSENLIIRLLGYALYTIGLVLIIGIFI